MKSSRFCYRIFELLIFIINVYIVSGIIYIYAEYNGYLILLFGIPSAIFLLVYILRIAKGNSMRRHITAKRFGNFITILVFVATFLLVMVKVFYTNISDTITETMKFIKNILPELEKLVDGEMPSTLNKILKVICPICVVLIVLNVLSSKYYTYTKVMNNEYTNMLVRSDISDDKRNIELKEIKRSYRKLEKYEYIAPISSLLKKM